MEASFPEARNDGRGSQNKTFLLLAPALNHFAAGADVLYCQVLISTDGCIYYFHGHGGGFALHEREDGKAAFYAIMVLEGLLEIRVAGTGKSVLRTGDGLLFYHPKLQVGFNGAEQQQFAMVMIGMNEQAGMALMGRYGLQHQSSGGTGESYCLHEGKLFLSGAIYRLCNMLEETGYSVLLEPFYAWFCDHIMQLLFMQAAGLNDPPVFSAGIVSILEGIKKQIDKNGGRRRVADLREYGSLVSNQELKNAFKALYGRSIGRYMLEKRMEGAKAALEPTGVLVKVVARRYGYKTVTGFIKAYKSVYGCTPGRRRE